MEDDFHVMREVHSVHPNLYLRTSIACLDKKRKLQAQQLDAPPSKHACVNQSLALNRGSYVFTHKAEGFSRNIAEGDMGVMSKVVESDVESAKDSNSIATDAETFMSASGDAETDEANSKGYASDQPSSSSSNWSSSCSPTDLFSLESRSLTKSGSGRSESTFFKNDESTHLKVGVNLPINIEEHLLGFGGQVDGYCSECHASLEECEHKKLEELLYSNGVTPESCFLSSGGWIVNQDTQGNSRKLTIDKEFEQYFSSLML